MNNAIGVDPALLEKMMDMTIAGQRSTYDALSAEAQTAFRVIVRAQLEATWTAIEKTRKDTIDNVLLVFDMASDSNSIRFIRDAIVKFKDMKV